MEHFHRYLPLSDETRRQSLYVIAGGYTLIPPHTPYPPQPHPADHAFRWDQGRTLPEHQLIYITRGGGVAEFATGGVRSIKNEQEDCRLQATDESKISNFSRIFKMKMGRSPRGYRMLSQAVLRSHPAAPCPPNAQRA